MILRKSSSQRISGNRLEYHNLTATPGLDPLIFDPVGTIQETFLTRNADEGVMGFPSTAVAETLVNTIKITGYTLRWITHLVFPRGG